MLCVTTLSCVSGTSCRQICLMAMSRGVLGGQAKARRTGTRLRSRGQGRTDAPTSCLSPQSHAHALTPTPRAVPSPRADYVGQQLPRVSRGTAGERRPPPLSCVSPRVNSGSGGKHGRRSEAQPCRGTVRQLGAAPSPEARCSGPWVRFSQEARTELDLSLHMSACLRLRVLVSDDEDLLPQRVLRPLHLPHRGQSKAAGPKTHCCSARRQPQ